MFESVLVANRGEIACRIMRTARRMGLRTVAVYSESDRRALHVREADECVLIGPPPARDSYLAIDNVIEAARRSGAQAVHPGYGFLAENPEFATACVAAGLVFVGPPARAIRAMGQKDEAKRRMDEAGVPTVPGYHGPAQDASSLQRAADEIGYPIIVKPVAGGGGKGMRIVEDADGFADARATAKREAGSAFGDERVLLEKYLFGPRHIEVQVFADSHGHTVHLFERDCSIQRRHQKVIEESPAPGLSDAMRSEIGEAAVKAAAAINYVGAGTVEFMLATANDFYFMEMNTRLQVEHPVTEFVTGIDLVEWQFRIASGEPLPLAQDGIELTGHAVEARLYAEDPERDFLPQAGRFHRLLFPEETSHLRIDTGLAEGDSVSQHYDPMIAKMIAWDKDRAGAIGHLRSALAQTQFAGPTDNLAFLSAVLSQRDFADAKIDTGFVDQHQRALLPSSEPADCVAFALAALAELLASAPESEVGAIADLHSPWQGRDGWRLNRASVREFRFRDTAGLTIVRARKNDAGFMLEFEDTNIAASGSLNPGGQIAAKLDSRPVEATIVSYDRRRYIFADGICHRLTIDDPLDAVEEAVAAGSFAAPMSGRITVVHVRAGERVLSGQPLIALEAMKMEHVISAPADGTVNAVHFEIGDQVAEGANLVDFDADDPAAGEGP